MSDAARGSSLALTNEAYPGAYEAGVKYVAVAGTLDFAGAETFDVGGVLRANKTVAQAWREYVAGISYKANTGNDAKVIGDGVCPVDGAALEGAVNIRVTCHHSTKFNVRLVRLAIHHRRMDHTHLIAHVS